MKLILEINQNAEAIEKANDGKLLNGRVLITPPVGEDYWLMRVKISDEQAIVGFPKFGTIGIGFAKEEDWNTNLPYLVPIQRLWEHIRHNKGDKRIPKKRCLEAIALIQAEAHRIKGTDPVKDLIP